MLFLLSSSYIISKVVEIVTFFRLINEITLPIDFDVGGKIFVYFSIDALFSL